MNQTILPSEEIFEYNINQNSYICVKSKRFTLASYLLRATSIQTNVRHDKVLY